MNRVTVYPLVLIVMIICALAIAFSMLYPNEEVTPDSTPEAQIGTAIQCVNINPGDNTIKEIIAKGFNVDYRDDVWYIDDIPVGYAKAEDESFALCGETELVNRWIN